MTDAAVGDGGDGALPLIIRTSEKGWFERLASSYRHKKATTVIDDAEMGVDPMTQTLLDMGRKAKLGAAEWTAVGIALGMSAAGVALIVMAVFDPEPTTKLGLLVAAGAVGFLGGGFSAIRVLTKHKPPNVEVGPGGVFRISWA